MNQDDGGRVGAELTSAADADRLLSAVEDDARLLDHLSTHDQVPVFDRLHTTLAEALARTADTGAPPAPGQPGA